MKSLPNLRCILHPNSKQMSKKDSEIRKLFFPLNITLKHAKLIQKQKHYLTRMWEQNILKILLHTSYKYIFNKILKYKLQTKSLEHSNN